MFSVKRKVRVHLYLRFRVGNVNLETFPVCRTYLNSNLEGQQTNVQAGWGQYSLPKYLNLNAFKWRYMQGISWCGPVILSKLSAFLCEAHFKVAQHKKLPQTVHCLTSLQHPQQGPRHLQLSPASVALPSWWSNLMRQYQSNTLDKWGTKKRFPDGWCCLLMPDKLGRNHDAPQPLIVLTKMPATTAQEHHDVGAVVVTSRQVFSIMDQSRRCFPNKGEFWWNVGIWHDKIEEFYRYGWQNF